MKYMKLLAAAALAMSLGACTSTPAEDSTVTNDENKVVEDDKNSVDKSIDQDKVIDENGGNDVDYGTPDSADKTNEVPTTADEQQAPEQGENVETNQD